MSEEDIANLTTETHRMRVAGSRWVLVSEQSMVMTIWSCKICMIMIYRRLTYETFFHVHPAHTDIFQDKA